MKARRNRIRLQKRRPRIRIESNPTTAPTWVRDRFVDGAGTSALWPDGFPWTQELVDDQEGAPDLAAAIAADLFERYGARRCRVCGCTDDDCSGCIERTGEPCSWVVEEGGDPELGPICSACYVAGVFRVGARASALWPNGFPWTQGPVGDEVLVGPIGRPRPRLRERFRILGWIFRLLRR